MIRRCLRCNEVFVARNKNRFLCPSCFEEVGEKGEILYMDMDDFLEGMEKEDVSRIPEEVI